VVSAAAEILSLPMFAGLERSGQERVAEMVGQPVAAAR
jgi:hypothetical protein